ncbi:UxaA family hydrolase [uncultured Dubosiella sp.]|uniref:UxaA family hydrolase n=1 Tax=uncultured Dubosiella sp. TaxID=1937011 RepID=UPI0025B4F742|nr:altronate dehydratase family protein [uncultured Dubosiella sp.]
MDKQWIQINPQDNVAVALTPLKQGERIETKNGSFELIEDIAPGHKFALRPIGEDENIIKYGLAIGHATTPIEAGQWVHIHNIKTNLGDVLDYTYTPDIPALAPRPEKKFAGYRRSSGKAGIRNEIWIIPTVGCVNNIAQAIEKACAHLVKDGVEAVCAFPHPYGCSQMGGDQDNTRRILADLIEHPNAGGVLVLGLGCENSNIDTIKPYLNDPESERIEYLVCQDVEDEIAAGIERVERLARRMKNDKREPIGASELVIGLKCGGSDGLSGITANPTVGAFSDKLIAQGGTTILTEVPEMFGAETLLMNRCENEQLFEQTVDLINGFKTYFQSHNQTIYENPSPGNKKGGISTLEDKSMGCTQKAGSAPVEGVLSYGERVQHKGLNLLSAPGNDLVASTALAASGAHMVLFTTGRGTPFASPVPTMKISSNSLLAKHKSKWIDFNCGQLLESKNLDELSDELLDFVLAVASGELVASEKAGFHDMAIFKQGVTL